MTDADSTDCVFCQIARGDLVADEVRRDEEFVAFHDAQPRAATHVLVIPREHHASFDDWVSSGGSSDRMLEFVTGAAADVGIAGRYRAITDVGDDGGQVVGHLHWHLLAGRRLPGF